MNRPSVYIESSVVSYLVSRPNRDLVVAAHQQITREWWDSALPGFEAYVSIFVLDEVGRGDPDAAKLRLASIGHLPLLEFGPEVDRLAKLYLAKLNIPGECEVDAYHMALASWHGMDYLVSWNCSHIASARVQRQLDLINSQEGIRTPVLCTPEELMEES